MDQPNASSSNSDI